MAERAMIRRAIRVATEDTFTSLRPERYASMTDAQIGLQIFETLVGYDPVFDDFVDRARRSHAAQERAELYAGACAVLEDLAPAVFLRHGRSIIARRSRVAGVDPHPLGDIDLAKAGWRC
jgi:hypothetical protein